MSEAKRSYEMAVFQAEKEMYADIYIKELEQKTKWISVKDRLPEENISVLGCDVNGVCADEREPVICYIENGIWNLSWSDKDNDLIITHWMPLPEVPNE